MTFTIIGIIFICVIMACKIYIRIQKPKRQRKISFTLDMPDEIINKSRKVKIDSSRNSVKQYNVDLNMITCTCPDFNETRSDYPDNDPRRLCKHLVTAFEDKELPDNYKPYEGMITLMRDFERGFPLYAKKIEKTIDKNNYILIIPKEYKKSNNIWVNILHNGESYGFNPEEGRWAFENIPPDEMKLAEWVFNEMPLKK